MLPPRAAQQLPVRDDMKNSVISTDGEHGKFCQMCATLAGTLTLLFGGQASTLAGKKMKETGSIAAVGALPLVFQGKLQNLRCTSVLAALRGIV